MSLTQRSQPGPTQSSQRVKPADVGPWLDACDDRRSGERRVLPTIDQIDCGLVLLVPGSKPQCLVVEVELGEAGNDAGDDLGDRRSSGEVGLVAGVA